MYNLINESKIILFLNNSLKSNPAMKVKKCFLVRYLDKFLFTLGPLYAAAEEVHKHSKHLKRTLVY